MSAPLSEPPSRPPMSDLGPRPLTIAVPKGRILGPLAALFARAGMPLREVTEDSRALVRDVAAHDGVPAMRFFLLKPDDVPTYVEYGVADLGVVGRDVIDENASDVYVPLDLHIGRCRLAVAARVGALVPERPRVATKYPRTAEAHFAAKGVQVDIVELGGSVELAPITGLADLIVDVVETGTTLAENGLGVIEIVSSVSSVLIANRVSYKLRAEDIFVVLERLEKAITP